MKTKEYKNPQTKVLMEKMLIVDAGLTYEETRSIDKTLDIIEKAMFNEDKINGFAEKVNYFADKIKYASILLSMRRIYEDDRRADITAIIEYIEKQIEKIRKEVNE